MSSDLLLGAVAAHGLDGGVPIDTVAVEPLDDYQFQALLGHVIRNRVVGQLAEAVVSSALPTTEDQAAVAVQRHLDWCTAMLGLERELLRVVDVLDGAGIDVVALKGTAVAHLYYEDPAQRMFGDNDILLRSDQFDAAVQVLTGAGYTRRKAPARPDFDRRFGKGVTLYREDGTELDLHRSLAFGSFGLSLDLDELWATTRTFELGGRELRALGAEASLIHAFFHCALSGPMPTLGMLRDLAQQLAAGQYDADRVIELGHRWQAMAVFKRSAILLERHLGITIDGPIGEAVAAYRPSARESRALASYAFADRTFTDQVLATLPFLPSTRERLAFLRAAVLPSREFTSVWGSDSLISWWARGARTLIRRLW